MQLLNKSLRFISAAALLAAFTTAVADPRVEQVWVCTLNDGKTIEDLNDVHRAWLDWANDQSYGGDIRGYVGGSVVSSDINTILIIDSYPDLETLSADWSLYGNSDEGQTLEARYDEVSTCTSNSLFFIMDSSED